MTNWKAQFRPIPVELVGSYDVHASGTCYMSYSVHSACTCFNDVIHVDFVHTKLEWFVLSVRHHSWFYCIVAQCVEGSRKGIKCDKARIIICALAS